ncbi:hypothetical protein RRG08_006556 [Elysia crispata]|uniref:Uncharacterized protein n=1 Tax=Elysia crispata TaxID=231223 RepID=A0AAE1EB79_9GAST|nr:hypothetical protein RRG08_006556 [Elysia crispata]
MIHWKKELSVVLSSSLPVEHVDLLEEPTYDSSVNLGALQVWCVCWGGGNSLCSRGWRRVEKITAMSSFTRDVKKREMDSFSKHPVLVVSAHVKRKLGNLFLERWSMVVSLG